MKVSKDKSRLLKNTISLILVQGGNYIVPLLTFPFLVRIFGVESYGIIAYSVAISQYFTIFAGFGLDLYAPRELALAQDDKEEINQIFSKVFTFKVSLLLVSFLTLLALTMMVPIFMEYQLILLSGFSIVIAQTLSPIWFFQGIEEMKWITVINLSSKFSYAIVLFAFFNGDSNIIWVPFVNGLTQFLSASLGLFLIFNKFDVKYSIPSFSVLLDVAKSSWPFFMSRISVSLYTVSNTFFLGTFGNMHMAGIYAMAEKLFTAMQGVYHPLVNALYPYISRNRDLKLFKKIIYSAAVLNMVFVSVVYVLADVIFSILFNDYSVEAVTTFRLLVLVALLIPISILLGYPFLGAFGHTKFTNYSVVFSSLFHIVALISLTVTKHLSIENVIYTLMFTELFVLLIRIGGVKKYNLWKS
jgi:PST family polysaccharide transporter